MSDTPPPASRDHLLAITLYLRSQEHTENDPDSTRSQIMASAISLFARKGYAGTSMREIAASVGIKAASLYSHCPDGKEQLLRLSLHDIFNKFLRYVTEDLRYEMTPMEQLESVVRAHVSWQLTFGEQAMAWDALVRQFGVVGVLEDDALAQVHEKQKLYHLYVDALVSETTLFADRVPEVSTAIRTMCDQAASWILPGDASEAAHGLAGERIWWLSRQLIHPILP